MIRHLRSLFRKLACQVCQFCPVVHLLSCLRELLSVKFKLVFLLAEGVRTFLTQFKIQLLGLKGVIRLIFLLTLVNFSGNLCFKLALYRVDSRSCGGVS